MYYPNGKEIDQMVPNDIACNCIPLERIAFLVHMHLILIAFCNSACFKVAAIWVSISFSSAFGCFLKYASEYKMHTPMYGHRKICILNANSEDLKCGSSSGSVLFIRIKMTFKDRYTSKLKKFYQ